MAMKLDPMEKRADSILRQYNNQLTKSYGQLGKTHTVSANLLSKARDLFGENNIRYNKNGVPQIARNRGTLKMYGEANTLRRDAQYTKGDLKGQYKPMYDVSKAYQRAVNQVRQRARNKVPEDILKIKDISKRTDKIKKYVNEQTNKKNIDRVLKLNDMIAELYGKISDEEIYSQDISEALGEFDIDFRNMRDNADLDELERMVQQRYDRVFGGVHDTLNEPLNSGATLDNFDL